jgi:ABC-type dipeptide/oligopeptide/nickel transport system permease component
MLTMVFRRMLIAVPSLIGVVIVTFLLTRALPGDPAAYFAGPAATKEAIEQIRVKLGLDQPLIVQFGRYVQDLAKGDLGNSLTTGQPVGTEIRTRLPASAELTLLGLVVSMLIAVPLGILAATRPGSIVDHACRVVATAGVSLPVFFTGLILVYVFYYILGWAPAPLGRLDIFFSPPPQVTGFYLIDSLIAGEGELFLASLKQLILPALTLAIFSLAPIARMTRASMLAVLASDFVRTARASGLAPYTVIVTYAFRNAMIPVVTTLGMVFSFLLGANVLVEKVFAWPGIGSFAVEALIASDFAPLQGGRHPGAGNTVRRAGHRAADVPARRRGHAGAPEHRDLHPADLVHRPAGRGGSGAAEAAADRGADHHRALARRHRASHRLCGRTSRGRGRTTTRSSGREPWTSTCPKWWPR